MLLCHCATQIAAGVILSWGQTIYEQFELLAGKSAPREFLQLLIYKAVTYAEEIKQIDTVRAYHVRQTLIKFPPCPGNLSHKLSFPPTEWPCTRLPALTSAP